MTKHSLQTPTSRARLAVRGKPHEHRLLPGVTLGYRRTQSGTGSWVCIAADGKGGNGPTRLPSLTISSPLTAAPYSITSKQPTGRGRWPGATPMPPLIGQ